jgi:tetratricopeptide (TPR) repeat protein
MKIAICMIAGNESAHIRRALDCAFTVTDLVVVVRAIGGQKPDDTMDIARDRGCVIGEYHNSPATSHWNFIDDFASARNESFRLAMQHGADWLMWMDCDDTLPEGMGEIIRSACLETKEDWILAEYILPMHGKAVWRERLFRSGTAAWFHGVHEKCVPISSDTSKESLKVRVRRDIKIVHDPIGTKSGSQERNINILRWRYQEAQHLAFYLHYEFYLLGDKEQAAHYGLEALRMKSLDGVYRYEVMMNLAMLAAENSAAQDLCKRAIRLCPQRREAKHLLSLLQMDNGEAEEALKTCKDVLDTPPPKIPEWTHKPDCYGWKAHASLAWANRLAGNLEAAKGIEEQLLNEGGSPRISLLHATRGRWSKAIGTYNLWLSRASNPAAVEHWFAIDSDDADSLKHLARFRHTVIPAGGFSVRAWNGAAACSTGHVLVQIADDFEPPANWDKLILEAFEADKYPMGGALFEPKVLRVSDGCRQDKLMTIGIVTRRWFEQYGLFHVEYKNVYSDTDLTATAEKAGAIIDAPHIVIKHHHPFFDPSVPMDATYERGNNAAEYERAKKIYETRHPKLV